MHAIGATLTSGGGTLLICVHRFTVAFAALDDNDSERLFYHVYDSDLRWFRTTQIVHRLYRAPRLSPRAKSRAVLKLELACAKGGNPRLMEMRVSMVRSMERWRRAAAKRRRRLAIRLGQRGRRAAQGNGARAANEGG